MTFSVEFTPEAEADLDRLFDFLLDRAETVFSDLTRIDQRAPQALKHLIGIYQTERDWEKAIDNATRYEDIACHWWITPVKSVDLTERFAKGNRSITGVDA